MPFAIPSFILAALLSWVFPLTTAALLLMLSPFLLACGRVLRAQAEALIKESPLYSARYWSDSEKDALEHYALYWNRPAAGPLLARLFLILSAACAGVAAGPWLPSGDWVFPALGLMAAAFLTRERRLYDPVAFHKAKLDRKDFSGSEEWGAIQEIQAFMNARKVNP